MLTRRQYASIGRLHIILSPDDGGRPRRSIPEYVRAVVANGADVLQYRRKEGSIGQWIEEGRPLRQECRRHGVAFIVNDRLDLALALDADGVHLGDDDMPLVDARRIAGSGMVIGRTTRSRDDVVRAEEEGADYVGFGPIHATRTKRIAVAPRGVGMLRGVAGTTSIPIIAIGGIERAGIGELIGAGAYGIAVVGAIAGVDDPAEETRRLRDAIEDALRSSEGQGR
jgi:thiamine-phosphate pyrophosphorylase